MEENFSFGYWLRRQRLARDWRQDELAARLGVATVTLRKLEADARRPSLQLIGRLVDLLGLPDAEAATLRSVARADLSPAALPLPQQPVAREEQLIRIPQLPLPANSLLGREAEVTELCALLRAPEVRLLTLTGPGGTGKTRLALQVAHELADAFADGAWFVDLTPLRDPAYVPPMVGRTLGLRETPAMPMSEVVAAFLRDRELLLVLDNCEQVLDAAPWFGALLAQAPRLRLLATSREMLRLSAERLYCLDPLATPPPGSHELGAAAAQLFLARARAAGATFLTLAEETGFAIAEICRRLDGLPLAVELAAARARHLPPTALLARLEQPLALLTGGPRDLPERQQALRATIGWSYELLDAAERVCFARLAVFSGGWTLVAAEEVIADGQAITSGQVFELLAALADKSLVRVIDGGGEPRFQMLETIRDYAAEQLALHEELDALQRRHAQFFLALVQPASLGLQGKEQLAWLSLLDADQHNIRAALAWSLDREPESALRFSAALWRYWGLRGDLREGVAWMDRAIAANTVPSEGLAHALFGAAMLNLSLGLLERRDELAQESLMVARGQGDEGGRARALALLAMSAGEQRDWTTAERRAREAEVLARDCQDDWALSQALIELGYALVGLQRITEARTVFSETIELCRTRGDRLDTAFALFRSCWCYADDLTTQMALLEEAERLAHEIDDHFYHGLIINSLGEVARQMGNYELASSWYDRGLSLSSHVGNRPLERLILINKGWLAVQQGELEAAAALFKQCIPFYGPHEMPYHDDILYLGAALLAQARGDAVGASRLLGCADEAGAGRVATIGLEDANMLAGLRAWLRSALGDDAYDTAYAAGRALPREAALREVAAPGAG